MKPVASVFKTAILLLAVAVAGCRTAPLKGRGKLCIDVYGKGARDTVAEVFVNGAKESDVSMVKGKGLFLFLPAGDHTVRVEADGFLPWERTVRIKPNETTWSNARMKRGTPTEAPPENRVEEEAGES